MEEKKRSQQKLYIFSTVILTKGRNKNQTKIITHRLLCGVIRTPWTPYPNPRKKLFSFGQLLIIL
jgi:hypothetical protein